MVTLGKWALPAFIVIGLLTAAQTPAGAVPPSGSFTLATKSLPPATDGLVYSAPLTTSDGMPYCSWTVENGHLPKGLQLGLDLGCDGQVVGTPEGDRPGRYPFSIEVFDFIGDSTTARFSITINSGPGPSQPGPLPPLRSTQVARGLKNLRRCGPTGPVT